VHDFEPISQFRLRTRPDCQTNHRLARAKIPHKPI
jgi:hypothetical protein